VIDPDSLLGAHGATKDRIISGPVTQERNGRAVTIWVTEECIDCDISRENCPAVFRHCYDRGRTEIIPGSDFFAELENVKRAVDQCPTTALGLVVEKKPAS
jgi:ferredoxin